MSFFDKILGKDKFKGEHFLVLDIGTGFVKTLVARSEKGKRIGEIVGAGIAAQKISHMQAGAVSDIEGVTETCAKAIGEAKKEARAQVSQVILGIAGEFVKGSTLNFSYTRQDAEEKIEMAELKNIIQKIQWKAFNKIRQELAEESGISEIEVKLINAAVVEIKIDGYQVTNPLGFQGKEISFSIFNAYAPLMHLGALNSIADRLKLDIMLIAAEPFAISRGVTEEGSGDAIFIDIGGGTTDIALSRQKGLEGIKSLALGGRAFSKRLAENLGLGFDEAEQIKLKYSQGEVSGAVKRKITEIFKQDIRVWLSGVALALSEFSQLSPLPSKILLCGGGSTLPGIKKALESQNWFEDLPFLQPPEVSFIDPGKIAGIEDKTAKLNSPKDVTPLALASLAMETIRDEQGIFPGILKRTIRLMQT
ncbi:MAG: cell division FtsA domain-containing protein [Candidatus Portnoybacteria bacterium]|nr:cell division FtsA domain-containing protein [Candidatus Portnoybacteria bacterium]